MICGKSQVPSNPRDEKNYPLAIKYSSLTPYNYSTNNPIRFIDSDGMMSEWKPGIVNGKLAAVAERGDNAVTLAKFLNVDQKRADALYTRMDKQGNILLTDDIPGIKSINATITDAKNNPDNYSNSFFAKITTAENYNCFGCALAIADGKAPDFSSPVSTSKFENIIAGFSEIRGAQSNLKFGQTIISFSEKSWDFTNGTTVTTNHASTYLGTSKDGTKYTWSKNGLYATPAVQTVSQLIKEYGSIVKYYNKNNKR